MRTIGFILISLFLALSAFPANAGGSTGQQPSTAPPVFVNRTRGVAAELIQKEGKHILWLKNLTAKKVVTVDTTGTLGGVAFDRTHGGKPDQILLEPGASIHLDAFPDFSRIRHHLTTYNESAQPSLYLSTILFDDLSFEGDFDDHLHTLGSWLGDKLQSAKLLELYRKVTGDSQYGPEDSLSMLVEQVKALDVAPNESESLPRLRRLPQLKEQEQAKLNTYIGWRLASQKRNALSALKDLASGKNLNAAILKSWLNYKISEYEKRIKEISVLI
jgi:hypothetical protein